MFKQFVRSAPISCEISSIHFWFLHLMYNYISILASVFLFCKKRKIAFCIKKTHTLGCHILFSLVKQFFIFCHILCSKSTLSNNPFQARTDTQREISRYRNGIVLLKKKKQIEQKEKKNTKERNSFISFIMFVCKA